MKTVYQAKRFKPCNMGSFGDARMMILSQRKFPHTYEDDEKLTGADSDRIQTWYGNDRWRKMVEKHNKPDELGRKHSFESFIERESADVLAFIVDVLKADKRTKWTGYRVLGTVNQRGYPIYGLELFAKKRGSKTAVYSGRSAPNIENWIPQRRSYQNSEGVMVVEHGFGDGYYY